MLSQKLLNCGAELQTKKKKRERDERETRDERRETRDERRERNKSLTREYSSPVLTFYQHRIATMITNRFVMQKVVDSFIARVPNTV